MSPIRYNGKLKKWNVERGFGFIVADDGGQDVFVHISAFPRDGRSPTEGEALSFEVEPDRNGKRSAVRVGRPGNASSKPERAYKHMARSSDHTPGESNLAKTLIGFLLIVAFSLFAYSRYQKQVVQIESLAPSNVVAPTSAQSSGSAPERLATPSPLTALPTPNSFQCDGRKHCSQMTSCKEAKFFLKNCPDVRMDGNHDGIPCEQQWCTSPLSD